MSSSSFKTDTTLGQSFPGNLALSSESFKTNTGFWNTIYYVSILAGDINNDGNIDLTDAMLALKVLSNISLPVTLFTTADVNGDVLGYTFQWYNGSSVGPTPEGTDPDHSDLDAGDYTVTATDISTGCVSDPVTVTVLDNRVYPEFEYSIVPANCESSNGSIELVFLDAYEIQQVTVCH